MNQEMQKNKQLLINMIAGLLNFLVSMGISLVLSPYVVNHIGADANAYVSMANNFVQYAGIFSAALNSLAGRFIAIKIHQNDTKGANEYFNSVMGANIVISIVLLIPVSVVIIFLDQILGLGASQAWDIRLLFGLVFADYFITIIGSAFSMATFAANKLYLTSLRNIEANVLKVGLYVLLFSVALPRVSYVGIVTCITAIYIFLTNVYYTKKLLPQIKVSRAFFRFQYVKDIVTSGVWNTIINLGQVLTNGLDLIITKLFVGTWEMGQLTPAKILSTAVSEMTTVMAYIFTPQLTIYYARKQWEELVAELKTAMKMAGFFSNIPLCFVLCFGLPFIQVWMHSPKIDSRFAYELLVLTVFGNVVGGVITPMFNLFTVTNRLKANAFAVLLMGIVSTAVVFLLLKTTHLGVYAVAGVSTTLGVIKNITFVPLYASECLHVKKTTFYPLIFRYLGTTFLILAVDALLAHYMVVTNWLHVFYAIFACGMAGVLINFVFLFGKKERAILIDFFIHRLFSVK